MNKSLVPVAFVLMACGQANLVDTQRDRMAPAIRSLLSMNRGLDPLAAPTLSSASPASIAMGGPDFVLTVNGSGFISESVLRWNGEDRATQLVSSDLLTANIAANDIATPGLSSLTVFNPGEDGGESNVVYFAVFVSQACNDLIYDPVGGLIWASVPNSGGNGVLSIDPYTGERSPLVFVGGEPAKLAISIDGQSLFVALNTPGAGLQFDIPSRTPGIQFTLGTGYAGLPLLVEDMQVLPGRSDSVAISKRDQSIRPRHAGVAIYDSGVMRPTYTTRPSGNNVIQFSNSSDRLYGYNTESTGNDFHRLQVDDSGVVILDSVRGLIVYAQDIRFDRYDERIYSNTGRAIDPERMILLGTFPNVTSGSLVAPDSANGRTFYLTGDTHILRVFDPNTFTPLSQAQIPGVSGSVTSLIRWGDDGLAFRAGNQIFIITSPVPPMPPTGKRMVSQR